MSSRVAPFGNPRINGYLLLPEAYRSLSRPSSAPDAKAFPLRSFQLDLLVAKSAWLRFRFRENFARSLAPRFRRKLVFGERGDGRHGLLLRVVREFLVLFENYAGFTKIEIVCHPASFRMLFHNQFASSVSPQRNLSVALLAFVTLFSFQGAGMSSTSFRLSLTHLPTAFAVRFEDPTFHSQVFKSKGKSPGGPEWARTTDLTIISRTL